MTPKQLLELLRNGVPDGHCFGCKHLFVKGTEMVWEYKDDGEPTCEFGHDNFIFTGCSEREDMNPPISHRFPW